MSAEQPMVPLSAAEVLGAVHDHLTSSGAHRMAHLVDYALVRFAELERLLLEERRMNQERRP